MFRFQNWKKRPALAELVDRTLEPRLNQIFVPLMSIIRDPTAREKLRAVARQCQHELISDRGLDTEAQVLEVLQEFMLSPDARPPSLKDITERFIELYSDEYERKITPRWIGYVLRKRLHLKPQKRHGVFIIPATDRPTLERLFAKYGLVDSSKGSATATDEAGRVAAMVG